MASAIHGVWAIDIGTNSLKALRLRPLEESFEVIGFDYIEHSKILSSEDVDEEQRDRIIIATLDKFVGRNDVTKEEVAISVAGHNSFARFIKLPPVEKKRVPEIVQFEAVQQIPFDINEVEWDWQIMGDPASKETEVGIFAIKNEVISTIMDYFARENIQVSCVQISPMALYNYALYDQKDISASGDKAVVILDMGAENTTLVVCSKSGVWQRSIRIGGNAFTEAIAETFKLHFAKAEKLKRTAPMSKYVRQLFTAMKPVFTDLGSEIQRSLGFYSSSGPGRNKGFSKIIALGGGMKLQGVAKYLQQSLGVAVIKPDSFKRLSVSPEVSAAKFHENVSDFGVVYGLAVQLLGQAQIKINLLPRKLARAMAWTRKGKIFTIAASLLMAVSLLSFASASYQRGQYNKNESVRRTIGSTMKSAQAAISAVKSEIQKNPPLAKKIKKQMSFFRHRNIIPLLNQSIIKCLPNQQNNAADAELYDAFGGGDVEKVVSIPRSERKQLFVTRISVDYTDKVSTAKFAETRRRKMIQHKYAGQGIEGISPEMMELLMEREGEMDMGQGGRFPIPQQDTSKKDDEKGKEKDGPGFVVIIEGYSPYSDIVGILDPAGVLNDQGKWGFITRLVNMHKVVPGCVFELYKKDDNEHFECDKGDVEADSKDMPIGIGIEKDVDRVPRDEDEKGRDKWTTRRIGSGSTVPERVFSEKVLFDPMTNEEMSKTYDIITQEEVENNPNMSENDVGRVKRTAFDEAEYIVRDHWFVIKAKFLWKNAPKEKPVGLQF